MAVHVLVFTFFTNSVHVRTRKKGKEANIRKISYQLTDPLLLATDQSKP